MKIENHILKTELVDIDALTPLQGGLKTLSDENFNRLRNLLIKQGFQFTLHVWESGGVIYIIDGHQRVHVLQQLRKGGWEVPPITCSFVKAANYHDAKELVLSAISQFGKIDKDGFDEFVQGEDYDLGQFDFPDFTIDSPEVVVDEVPINPHEVEGSVHMSDEIGVDKEFLLIVFESEDSFDAANELIKNDFKAGYWLSKNKKNPLFFRKGPNRVLSGELFTKQLRKLMGRAAQ